VLAIRALSSIGLNNIANALLSSSPSYVLIGLAVMCAAMAMRAFSWHAILKAALPDARIKLSDAMQGTFIGVLMSSTLPARLGEPSRALVVALRTGRPRENLPVVLGTLVSQTLLNMRTRGAALFQRGTRGLENRGERIHETTGARAPLRSRVAATKRFSVSAAAPVSIACSAAWTPPANESEPPPA
jgi:hypothetical protein